MKDRDERQIDRYIYIYREREIKRYKERVKDGDKKRRRRDLKIE